MRPPYYSMFGTSVESPLFRMLVGLFYIMTGIRGVTALVQLGMLAFSGFSTLRLTDIIVNLALAGLCFWCARTLIQRNRLVFPAFVAVSLSAMAYAYVVGRGFSYGAFGVMLFYLAAMTVMVRRGELQ